MSSGNRIYSAASRLAIPKRNLAPLSAVKKPTGSHNSLPSQQQERRRLILSNHEVRSSLNHHPRPSQNAQEYLISSIESAIQEFLKFRGYNKTLEVFACDIPFKVNLESCEAQHLLLVISPFFIKNRFVGSH